MSRVISDQKSKILHILVFWLINDQFYPFSDGIFQTKITSLKRAQKTAPEYVFHDFEKDRESKLF
jgi:hypothetical protein